MYFPTCLKVVLDIIDISSVVTLKLLIPVLLRLLSVDFDLVLPLSPSQRLSRGAGGRN